MARGECALRTEQLAGGPRLGLTSAGTSVGDLTLERIAPRLHEISDVEVVDLLPGLRQRADQRHWGDLDPHFSPEGHALWFELVRPALEQALRERHD